jgi:hypothetical protein
MRVRLPALRPTLLALAFTTLLAVPAAAQSAAQATIVMEPESAAPGTAVELSGSGFPAGMSVALQLTTATGSFDLATAATERDGTFRRLLVLPALPESGVWAVEARALDGTSARYAFDPTTPVVTTVVAPAAAPASAAATEAARADGASSDGVFLVIIGCLLGMVSTGALYAWRMLHDERVQPGMGRAADVIWNEGLEDEQAEPTATTEPFWKAAPIEDEAAGREVPARETPKREVAGAGEQEAPASA